MNKVLQGDCRELMRGLIDDGVRVQCVVTSPPYWGLRDYGVPPSVWGGLRDCAHEWGDGLRVHKGGPSGDGVMLKGGRAVVGANDAVKDINAGNLCTRCGAWRGCLGLEPDYRMYVANMVEVFDLVRELLADDGTLWLNLGDSYAASRSYQVSDNMNPAVGPTRHMARSVPPYGLKQKDLIGIPWRVAFALQEAGWWLRQDIIWSKPNPMPESVTDRCTKAHEYLFLLAKSERYQYDAEAIREPAAHAGSYAGYAGYAARAQAMGRAPSGNEKPGAVVINAENRNRRSVWRIAMQPYPEAHFATFPEALVEPCILAGSRPGDIVFDPFMGSGTVASVAQRLGRRWLGCELNLEYVKLIEQRTRGTLGLELSA